MNQTPFCLCLWLVALGIMLTTTLAQAQPAPAPAQPVAVPNSQQFDLTAPSGLIYRIFIAIPREPPPPSGYATFYVLDANAMFLTAVDSARFQKGLIPSLIIGIGYPIDETVDQKRRYHDFTPVTPFELIRQSGSSEPVQAESTGGQDEFLDFIEDTLKPEIARRFPVDSARSAIFGHSLAGRWVLYALFTRPNAFQTYIATSPSIWWNDRSILKEAAGFVESREKTGQPVNLLMVVGEMEQKLAAGTKPDRAEFLNFARMVDSARELAAQLQPLAEKGVNVLFIELKDENHGSVVPPAIARSLRFALLPAAK